VSDSKKPLFGTLFSKDTENNDKPVNDELLLQCLNDLVAIGIGVDKKVDFEIAKLKKMLKIGTSHTDISGQVQEITQAFFSFRENDQISPDAHWFKQLPATVLVDSFLEAELEDETRTKLTNYRSSLNSELLATAIIIDLISLLEPDSTISDNSSQVDNLLTPELIHQITSPMLTLVYQLDLGKQQVKMAAGLRARAETLNSYDELCLFLEDISQLILSSVSTATDQFENFLVNLKQRLDCVGDFISHNDHTSRAISACSDDLTKSMNEQVGELRSSVSEAKTLDEIQGYVATSLDTIVMGLDRFNRERKVLQSDAEKQVETLEHQLNSAQAEAENLRDNLQKQSKRAMTDSLTKLPNRHAYNERLHLEYNRWRRYKTPLTLVFCDLDYFKKVNDTYGHTVGDIALEQTAHILSNGLRDTDFVARYGGEEFVMLLPETTIKDAIRAMNKLRSTIQNNKLSASGKDVHLTMSFGVATFEQNDDFNHVFNRADTALYRAKSRGRNQVCAELKKKV